MGIRVQGAARGRSNEESPGSGAGIAPGPARDRQTSRSQGWRDSVESFVVVLLAFLLWSLEAEGFVIPTGSMAPTLMGRHKEITCPECGYVYTVNADRETEPDRNGRGVDPRIAWGTCENCRYETAVADAPSFSGDRIYVMKQGVSLPFLEWAGRVQLRRWDVAVFKLPEEPEVRYIKRLVGMPDEVLRIQGGDVWVRPRTGDGPFERPLRPLEHQQAMQVMVYDDRHRPSSLSQDPAWRRWSSVGPTGWTEPDPGTFEPRPSGLGAATDWDSDSGWAELRYRHLVPGPEQWAAIRRGGAPGTVRPSLITDFSSYNTDVATGDRRTPEGAARSWLQPHWVGDLTISMRLDVRRPVGRLRLDLIREGQSHRCEIDLATGEARLFRNESSLGPAALTRISRPGSYQLTFSNVDGRLTLWVDGDLPFGEGVSYPSGPRPGPPTAADLEPVRIAARQAEIAVAELVLKRDVYYTLEPSQVDYANLNSLARIDASVFFELLSNPEQFARLVPREPRDYSIAPSHYLMLGDNSPWSRDGRAWGRAEQIDPARPARGGDESSRASWEVPERLLIGKAFCVYLPHLQPVWPKLRLGPDLYVPALPYVGRMRWIR
jgi:signal peptidase I